MQEYVKDIIVEIRNILSKLLLDATSPSTGDATAANQVLEIAELTAINDKTLTPISRKLAFDDTNLIYYWEIVTFDVSTGAFVYYYRDKDDNVVIPDFGSFTYAEERVAQASFAINTNTSNTYNVLNNLSKDTGDTINTLRVVLEDQTRDAIQLENWDKIVGNSKAFTWVAGALGGFVVDTIEYYTGVTLMLTQTFAYDLNDNVTSITAS